MPKRAGLFFAGIFALFLSGCVSVPYKAGGIPSAGIYHTVGSGQNLYRISKAYGVDIKDIMKANSIHNPNQIGVGERIFIPNAKKPMPVEPHRYQRGESLARIVGEKQYRVQWRTITLHHSATSEGNAESFDRNHRHRGMGGLFYHFVIGNGTGSGDGEIEVGWRWVKQAEVNRRRDIDICLVGDFNEQQVTPAQYDSLMKLLIILEEEYSIPLKNIRRHKDLPGLITECPGRNFPFARLKKDLRRA